MYDKATEEKLKIKLKSRAIATELKARAIGLAILGVLFLHLRVRGKQARVLREERGKGGRGRKT